MHDWSDNELDGMSREAAENYGPGRGMPDWDALQHQLDKELPQGKENNRRKFIFLIFLCLVLTGITGYLLISQNSGTTNNRNEIISHTSQQPGIDNNKPDKNSDAGPVTIKTQKENVIEKKNGNNDDDKQSLNTPDKLSDPSTAGNLKKRSALSLSATPQNYSSNPSAGNKIKLSPRKEKSKNKADGAFAIAIEGSSTNRKKLSESKTGPQKGESAIVAATVVTEADKTNTIVETDAAPTETDKSVANQTAKAKDTVATVAALTKAPTVKSSSKSSAIEISILAGIDVSNVKFKYSDNAGLNAGLLFGYKFNKKWSVGTGLIYTKKNYTAAGTDFNPPKGYWTNGIKLDKVDGSCYMWEVPVYATYHFNSTRKSAWFVTMGLSSYFMTKEDYTYHYKYMNGNPATRYWQNSDPSNNWFSVLGISGGWEKSVGRGLSLGVAPYAKIPLTGIGFGDMRLSSYGLNLLLTYRKATGRK